jgi:hypothetical protein
LEKSLGGGGEEYLFGGIDGSHDVGWTSMAFLHRCG